MKTSTLTLLAAMCTAVLLLQAQPTNPPPGPPGTNAVAPVAPTPPPPVTAPAPPLPETKPVAATSATTNSVAGTPPPAAAEAAPGNPDELRLNFRGAPLDVVLNYLSEAAGFIIVLEAQPRGRVDVWSSQPVTREEAVDLLNSVLNKNGYAAIRRGRTLTIINKDEAKVKAIPVKLGAEPETIPDNDQMVTQIIPVRFVEVAQLIKDLTPLVSPQTAMTANESGNSIVITDTQANIRRVAEIIKAIDSGAEDVTEVRVFHLQYADPNEMADLLANLFPDDSRSGTAQSPIQFGGFRRFFGGGMPSSTSSGNQSQRIKKRARVVAVPDPRTSSVVVTAAKDLIDQIGAVVVELDSNPARKQTVRVFPLQNADPQDAMQVLQDMFEKNGTTANRNNQQNQNVLQNRSQQQNQQMNNNTRSSRTGTSSRTRSFGQ